MRAFLFTFLFFFFSISAQGTDYRFFAAVGPLYIPNSFRFGINEWDIGMLGPNSFGVSKNYYLGGLPYMGFGLAISDSFGFYGAMGLIGNLFWKLRWRIELESVVAVTGTTKGNGLVGLELKF
ncbi:MAG: hypothetical protein A4S09_06165 [Proteobacteria bacterium SG_bin7]|nr:MAG: hypothetical protein A4S09_06165 [Proteobacteria bacterium SG_bin7]